ncbi:Integrase, catalytic core [Gossypium australe]|uniref:Integrase, catalytic core n=1 Tax=Gossypium australe TaxID=47621 RepID=A0A5B6X546_9ROSI|nr:Integrase, catalytic core [Gossypium australe]
MRSRYYQLKVKDNDVLKTTFHIDVIWADEGTWAFMDLMNRIFQPYQDQFVFVFINDLLIYSRSEVENDKHLRIIL